MTSKQLDGSHALVTGANGGIGLAVTKAYLKEGAKCTATDITLTASDDLLKLQKQYPQTLRYKPANIVNTPEIKTLVDEANNAYGGIDVLFNNAGIFDMAPLLESDEEMYQKLFDVNVKGMFFTMQTVLQSMLNSGKTEGSIINVSSQAGRRGESLVSHYCASKAAVISYTQSAALAMAPHGIRVNSLSPGVIDTPMWEHVDGLFARYENLELGEKKKAVGNDVPLGRMGLPQDMTGTAIFLASKHSAYITAQTINVDGGNIMS